MTLVGLCLVLLSFSSAVESQQTLPTPSVIFNPKHYNYKRNLLFSMKTHPKIYYTQYKNINSYLDITPTTEIKFDTLSLSVVEQQLKKTMLYHNKKQHRQ